MNTYHEFFKIKEGFKKVKEDMGYLSEKIGENYDEFVRRHRVLSKDIENITVELKKNLDDIRENHLHKHISGTPSKELLDFKSEIKLLKHEIKDIQRSHLNVTSSIEDIKSNKKEIKSLKEKLHSGELEIFLLKERLIEKDTEVKQIKEITKHLFNVVDELSKTELDILNLTHKNKDKK